MGDDLWKLLGKHFDDVKTDPMIVSLGCQSKVSKVDVAFDPDSVEDRDFVLR